MAFFVKNSYDSCGNRGCLYCNKQNLVFKILLECINNKNSGKTPNMSDNNIVNVNSNLDAGKRGDYIEAWF